MWCIMAQGRNNNKGNGKGRGGPPRKKGGFQRPQVVRNRPPIPAGLSPNHHFNAFGPQKPQALAFSIGPATHIGGLASSSETTQTGNPIMFVFQPSGGYYQLAKCTTTDSGVNFTWSNYLNIASTGISTTGVESAVSPAQVLCSRGSIRVRNTSRAADAGGVVRVLRTGTPISVGSTELGYLYEMVKNHPHTHTYTGSSLTAAHQWDSIPIDQSSYSKFIEPTSAYGVLSADKNPAVSSVIIVFEAFSTVQNIELTVAACYYGRYRYAGPLASMASLPPTTTLARTNILRDIAESVGSAGRKVADATGNALVARLIGGAEGFVGNLFRQNINPGRLAGRYSTVSSIEDMGAARLAALTM
jgi:hypothetical protein